MLCLNSGAASFVGWDHGPYYVTFGATGLSKSPLNVADERTLRFPNLHQMEANFFSRREDVSTKGGTSCDS